MLLELNIRNIALIESLRIEFSQGFNVLTGETGSGKSIVVDCMGMVLGGRAERDLVRHGSEKGSVQALFDISDNDAARIGGKYNRYHLEQYSRTGVTKVTPIF